MYLLSWLQLEAVESYLVILVTVVVKAMKGVVISLTLVILVTLLVALEAMMV